MKLFAGLDDTDYQDVFRALGAMLDELQYRDVRLWEHEDGIILQVRRRQDGEAGLFQTYLMTDDDLRELLQKAYQRRGIPGRRILANV